MCSCGPRTTLGQQLRLSQEAVGLAGNKAQAKRLEAVQADIDKILNHRKLAHGREYLVRWKGYSKEHDSWEPPSSFDDETTISNYWKRRAGPFTRRKSDFAPQRRAGRG